MADPIEISLSSGETVLIDAEDLQFVEFYSWHAAKRPNGQIRAQARAPNWAWEPGTPRRVLMHRIIANPPDGYRVEHLNGNGLDNRRDNLHVPTILDLAGYVWDIGAGAWRWFVDPDMDGPDVQEDSGHVGEEADAALERDRALVLQLGFEGAGDRTNHSHATLRRLLGLDGASEAPAQPDGGTDAQ